MRTRTMFSSTSREYQKSVKYGSQAKPLSATSGLVKVNYYKPPTTHLTPSLNLDLTPAPPVGFNLTFECSDGEVFDHDWFAAPFILMTCQVTSVSSLSLSLSLTGLSSSRTEPSTILTGLSTSVSFVRFHRISSTRTFSLAFILATTTECFDCTTTSKLITQFFTFQKIFNFVETFFIIMYRLIFLVINVSTLCVNIM